MRHQLLVFLITINFVVISCKSGLTYIDNSKELTYVEINNPDLLRAIEEYKNENEFIGRYAIEIMSRDFENPSSTKFIHHTYSIYRIYKMPISAYTIIDGDLILIYSRKDKFLNPRNYPDEFVKLLKSKVNDDWTLKSDDDIDFKYVDGEILNHTNPWKFMKGDIIARDAISFNRSRTLFGCDGFSYFEFDEMLDLRE